MLPWGLCHHTIQLCSLGGDPLLQAPFLSTFQGEGKLQPSDQVCIGQAYRSTAWTTSTASCWFLLILAISTVGFEGKSLEASFFLLKTTWLYVMPSSPNDTGLLYFGIPGCSSWITLVNHGTVIFNEIVVHPILKSGILPLLIDILLCCLAILYCSLVTYLRIIPCFRILFGWVNFASLKIGRKVTCFWRILSS